MVNPSVTCSSFAINTLPLYAGFTAYTPTIPKFYLDVYSQEERIKAICMEICKIIAYAEATGAQVNANTEDIEKLATELANIKEDFADEFEDYFKERIAEWLDAHIYEVLDKAVRFVQFGLSQDGYFQAYIPENWDFLQFDTGMVYGRDDYGHLIIRY